LFWVFTLSMNHTFVKKQSESPTGFLFLTGRCRPKQILTEFTGRLRPEQILTEFTGRLRPEQILTEFTGRRRRREQGCPGRRSRAQ